MKHISNMRSTRSTNRILTPDGLRAGLDNDLEKNSIYILEMLAKFRNEGIVE